MSTHACFALSVTDLDVVVIDDSRNMQTILRSMLNSMKVHRVRVFSDVEEALPVILADPPNLILSEWELNGFTGHRLLSMLRARFMGPLCYVPVIFLTSFATAGLVEKAIAAGAHMVLIKPISPNVLAERIAWLLSDAREMELGDHGLFEIDGVAEKLRDARNRKTAFHRAIHQRNPAALSANVSTNGPVKITPPDLRSKMGETVPEPAPSAPSLESGAPVERPPVAGRERTRPKPPVEAAAATAKPNINSVAAWLEYLRSHEASPETPFMVHADRLMHGG